MTSTPSEQIPMDHSAIRIASEPVKKFSGDAAEYDAWYREIVNKAAVNGLASVIKGVKPTNWTNHKWEDVNTQYLGHIRLSLTQELETQIDESETLVKPVLDKFDNAYNKITVSKKSVLLKELLNIKQGGKTASTTITEYYAAYTKLERSKFSLDDMKLFFMLNCLDNPAYEVTKEIISNADGMTCDQARIMLINREQAIAMTANQTTNESTYVVQEHKSRPNIMSNAKCNNCESRVTIKRTAGMMVVGVLVLDHQVSGAITCNSDMLKKQADIDLKQMNSMYY
jgi:hypothetical protein